MVVIRSAQGKLVGLSTMCIRSGYKARGRNRQPFTHRPEMREVSPRPVSRGRCRDAAAFCFVYGAESPRRAVRTEMEARREIYPQTKRKPSDTRCRGLWALSCSDFVEVNRIVWLKCSARRVLHGQRVWDAAQQVLARQGALYIQRHCLQRLWWYHGALLAMASASSLFYRYDVGLFLWVTVIVAALF